MQGLDNVGKQYEIKSEENSEAGEKAREEGEQRVWEIKSRRCMVLGCEEENAKRRKR